MGWSYAAGLNGRSGSDGRFEIRGRAEAERLRLTATRRGWFGAPVEFAPGAADLVVPMEAGGGVAGSFVFEPGFPVDLVRPVLELPGRGLEPFRAKGPGADGEFTWRDLPPGAATVAIHLRGEREPYLVVEDVAVAAGEQALDPRLQGIDLRALIHVALDVTNEGGEFLHDARVLVSRAGEAEPLDLPTWGQRLGLLSSRGPVDVDVLAPGHRLESARSVAGARRFRLRPGIPVRVAVPATSVPDPGERVKVTLAPDELLHEELRGHLSTSAWTDSAGEVLVRLPEPGPWTVVLQHADGSSLGVHGPFQVEDAVDERLLQLP